MNTSRYRGSLLSTCPLLLGRLKVGITPTYLRTYLQYNKALIPERMIPLFNPGSVFWVGDYPNVRLSPYWT